MADGRQASPPGRAAGDGPSPECDVAPRLPRRLIGLLIAAELLLFGAAGYLASRFDAEIRASRTWAERSQEVETAFTDLRLTNGRLASNALYHLNNDAGQHGPKVRLMIEEVRRRLAGLQALVAGEPELLDQLGALSRLLEARLVLYDRILDEVPPGDAAAARPIVTELSHSADLSRAAATAFTAEVRERRAERERGTDAALRRGVVLLIAAFATAFLFGAVATLLFLNQLRLQRSRWLELARANAEIALQAEAARSSQRRLNVVLDNARDGFLLVSPELEITMANGACATLLGLGQEEIVGRSLRDFLPDFEVEDGPVWRNQAVRADGTSLPVEVSVGSCQLDDGPATICVLRDVTERQRLEQVKDDFVSTVSHELRTPLTSIRGSLGLVVNNAAGELPAKARALLEIAHKNSERLVDLVNDLLDIQKIETHRIAMRRERVEVARLIGASVEANQNVARQFDVAIEVAVQGTTGPAVLGDPGRLEQVLTNLLSNAVKFSPPGARVVVSLDSEPDEVTVAVRDFGPGIPEAFKPHVFKRFAQADAGDTRRTRGTGLGLSIVRSIVERHGGTVGFESPLPDGGTRFWFRLRRLPDEAGTVAEEDPRPAVLICEDNVLVATLIQAIIEKDGWRTLTVPSAEAALAQLEARRFAAMTVDLKLPGMSGIDLIRRIGADDRHRSMPIVVVSAAGSEQRNELDGYAASLVDWIDKPVDEDRLRRVLLSAVNGREAGLRILHVEDDGDVLAVVREVIDGAAEVEAATSLQAARELLVQRRFDLVILDVQLPDGNGLDLVPLLKLTQERAALLILSAEDIPEGGFGIIQASLTKARTDNAGLAQTIGRLLGQARIISS